MILIAGDLGIQKGEDDSFEDLSLVDVWKQAGCDGRMHFTLDTNRNKFNKCECIGGTTERYDRIYSRGLPLVCFEMADEHVSDAKFVYDSSEVEDSEESSNVQVREECHFISDQFGLRATFGLPY